MKKQPKISNPYTLKMRVFNQVGEPGKWFCKGTGQMIDIDTVKSNIRRLAGLYPNNKVEIEFFYDGQLRDYEGNPTGKSIILDRRV
jgi:hypothetical protein